MAAAHTPKVTAIRRVVCLACGGKEGARHAGQRRAVVHPHASGLDVGHDIGDVRRNLGVGLRAADVVVRPVDDDVGNLCRHQRGEAAGEVGRDVSEQGRPADCVDDVGIAGRSDRPVIPAEVALGVVIGRASLGQDAVANCGERAVGPCACPEGGANQGDRAEASAVGCGGGVGNRARHCLVDAGIEVAGLTLGRADRVSLTPLLARSDGDVAANPALSACRPRSGQGYFIAGQCLVRAQQVHRPAHEEKLRERSGRVLKRAPYWDGVVAGLLVRAVSAPADIHRLHLQDRRAAVVVDGDARVAVGVDAIRADQPAKTHQAKTIGHGNRGGWSATDRGEARGDRVGQPAHEVVAGRAADQAVELLGVALFVLVVGARGAADRRADKADQLAQIADAVGVGRGGRAAHDAHGFVEVALGRVVEHARRRALGNGDQPADLAVVAGEGLVVGHRLDLDAGR